MNIQIANLWNTENKKEEHFSGNVEIGHFSDITKK